MFRALLAALVLLPASLAAQDGNAVFKIGVVDVVGAVEGSDAGQTAATQWNDRANERGSELQSKQDQLRGAQARLQAEGSAMSESAVLQLNRDIERMTTDLNRMNEDIQIELDQYRQELLLPVAQRVDETIQLYAKENSFSLILDISNPDVGLAFATDAANITENIIELMNTSEEPPPGDKPPPI